MATVYTIGHSNTPVEALIDQLLAAGVDVLIDVRRYPQSRRWPQFNRDRLAASLADAGINYRHAESLGGRRAPRPDSRHTGLTNEGFRGYADYMEADEFEGALASLLQDAEEHSVAVMCAEALPWRCHRSLISDALIARGHEVVHLYGGKQHPHAMTPVARVDDGRVSYPALV